MNESTVMHYSYCDGNSSHPGIFAKVSATAEQKVELLKLLDIGYGNTPQSTLIWVEEYHVICCMLLHNDLLLINPKHLIMSDMADDPKFAALIQDLLGPDAPDFWKLASKH